MLIIQCILSQQLNLTPYTDSWSNCHFIYYRLAIRHVVTSRPYLCTVLNLSPDPLILKLSNFRKGSYRFTEDLLALESASPPLHSVPYEGSVSTPLQPEAWDRALQSIPDRAFTHFISRGIRGGFRIGVRDGAQFKPSTRNLKSAYDQPEIITAYIEREVQLGRLTRLPEAPVLTPPLLQVSPFGVIPKKHRPNKWRLIVNLSSPEGHSINDAISEAQSSVAYTSIDQAVSIAHSLGKGCLLAKLDLKEAYRAVPVHPSDQRFLAVSWKGITYLDKALPFGLRSAPKLFSALTDAMMWFLHDRGIETAIHYLDDFLVLGPPNQPHCERALHTALNLCEELGFSVAPEKTEGPTTVLTFLGIEVDTQQQQVRLPQEKLQRLRTTISCWMRQPGHPSPRVSGKKRDLLSLIGLLNHAASVVRPGRAFLRGLIDASSSARDMDHWVHLNRAARADLAWWFPFLTIWNGVSFMPPAGSVGNMVSDASGSWGCGAAYENLWFQLQWPESWATVSIAPKELVPIVVAVTLWGPYWAGQRICCLCDNAAVVAAVNKGAAKDPALSHLLRVLALVAATLNLYVVARHLPGVENTAADALSRNKLQLFFSITPQASAIPTIVPPELRELVFSKDPHWDSQNWMALLSTSWAMALHLPPARHTNLHSAAMQRSA